MIADPEADRYFGLRDLAQYSGLSPATLVRHMKDADRPIPHARIGGRILVKRSDFDAWVAEASVTPKRAAATVREAYAGRATRASASTWAKKLAK